ncbi:MAG: glycosyltransferase [Acutalibacteraceae bacterium]|nr:glycosyltransferase [Acutalibacteraceae bacterium]
MSKPKISIIVPVYNLENYIEKTVTKLTNQTYQNIEIILVDDGSTDKSPEICDKLAEKDSRVKVVHTVNQGVSSARNTGVANASGEYIGFCDGDDDVEDDMYEFLYNNLVEADADISICGVKIINPDNSVSYINTGNDVVWDDPAEYLKALFCGNTSMGVYTKLFKAEICKSIEFPRDLKVNEDKVYCFLSALKAKRITFKNDCKYLYMRRVGSATIGEFTEKFFDAIKAADRMMDIIEKSYPQLVVYAQVNKLSTILRTYKMMVLGNGLKKYPEKATEIKQYIKGFDKNIVKKYLSKKEYIRYTTAKTSEFLFAFMTKNFDKK